MHLIITILVWEDNFKWVSPFILDPGVNALFILFMILLLTDLKFLVLSLV